MKVSTLGPEGTYSNQAALQYAPEADLVLADSISGAIDIVASGECQQGIVPIANSVEGIVTVTLDDLFEHNLLVRGELVLDIHHTLAGLRVPENSAEVARIYSHPHALAQCRRYFERHYPEADIVGTTSTAAGMMTVAEDREPSALAVGPDPAVDVYGLERVDTEIEDEAGNQTRFVAFSKDRETEHEQDFIMLAVVPDTDRPGLIHDVTGVFKKHGVSLSELHSRPMRNQLGFYKFYMQLNMKSHDPRYEAIAAAIEDMGNQVVRMSA